MLKGQEPKRLDMFMLDKHVTGFTGSGYIEVLLGLNKAYLKLDRKLGIPSYLVYIY